MADAAPPTPDKPRCQICGAAATADGGQPSVCRYLCFWTLEGWLGWNARTGKVAVRDQRALRFVPTGQGDPAAKISYPKMVAMARTMGWNGRKEAGTFPAAAPAKAKAMAAAAGN